MKTSEVQEMLLTTSSSIRVRQVVVDSRTGRTAWVIDCDGRRMPSARRDLQFSTLDQVCEWLGARGDWSVHVLVADGIVGASVESLECV